MSKLDDIINGNFVAYSPDIVEDRKAAKQQIKELFLELIESCDESIGLAWAPDARRINAKRLRQKVNDL